MKRLLAYAAIYILWGASFLAIREIVAVVPPYFAAGVRFLLAGLVLLVFAWMRRLPAPRGREWRSVAMLSGILFVGCYGLLFYSEQSLPSGIAAVIAATIPAWVFVMEWLWLRRVRLTGLTAAGLLLGLGGVAGLVLPPHFLSAGMAGINHYAAVLSLASVLWAFGTVLSTRVPLPGSPVVSSGWEMALGGLGLLAVSGLLGEWHRVTLSAWTAKTVLGMVYLIVFASVLAFSAYVYLLAVEPAARVASYAYINPVVAVLVGTMLGGEALTAREGFAGAAVVLGVVVTLSGKSAAKFIPAAPAAEPPG